MGLDLPLIPADGAHRMRCVLTTLGVIGVIVLVIALLASGSLGLALGLGWVMKHLFSFDLFHGTVLGLIAVVAGEMIVVKVMRPLESSPAFEEVEEEDDDVDEPPAHLPKSVMRDMIAIVDGERSGRGGGGRGRRTRGKGRR
jgi:hypothetical protein